MMDKKVKDEIIKQIKGNRRITFLVGAGLSAESGIPVFRGESGYWTVGSKNYTPQEIGTKKMFDVNFDQVWRWYLYRNAICQKAQPNKGHIFLSKIEQLLNDRFTLISQNVDGLHFRKESLIENVYLIHGDLRYMRCSEECTKSIYPMPKKILEKKWGRDTPLTYDDKELLICPKCGELSRPHILWFDERYNDYHYYLSKVLRIAKETGLLFVIGTSGATTLPQVIVENTLARQGVAIDVNPNDNYFSDKFERMKNGYRIKGTSSKALEEVYKIITENI